MYKGQFLNIIKRELPQAVLLFGDSSFEIREVIDFFIKATKVPNSGIFKYYFDEYNFNSIRDKLSQASLFGDINFILIKRDKRVAKGEIDKLIDLTLKSDSNYLIFHFLGSFSEIKPLLKSFNIDNRAVWVRFFKPSLDEMVYRLKIKSKDLNVTISNKNLMELIRLLEGDLDLALKELEKLAILDREVNLRDIEYLVYSTTPIVIDNFLVKLFNRENITLELRRLLEFGEDEFSILRFTQNFIYQLILFKLYINIYGRVDSRDILGYKLPLDIERRRVKISSNLNFKTLSKLSELLIDMEIRLKNSSTISRETLLLTGFIELQRAID